MSSGIKIARAVYQKVVVVLRDKALRANVRRLPPEDMTVRDVTSAQQEPRQCLLVQAVSQGRERNRFIEFKVGGKSKVTGGHV